MSDQILIEPDGPHRPAFALWGLAQRPAIQTASASGWLVPLTLYPSVPVELLEGAYVDGFLYNNTAEQPKVLATQPPQNTEAAVEAPAQDDEAPVETAPPQATEAPAAPARRPRRTRRQVTE